MTSVGNDGSLVINLKANVRTCDLKLTTYVHKRSTFELKLRTNELKLVTGTPKLATDES